jgi:hypothetical protein
MPDTLPSQHGGRRPGAGRRRGQLRVSVTLRVLPETARNLGVVAFQNNVSKGQVLDAAAGLLLELVRRLP